MTLASASIPTTGVPQQVRVVMAWVRRVVRSKAREPGGTTCPACGQHAQVYRRKINSGMAKSLILMYRHGQRQDGGWVHVPTAIGSRSREEGKLAYWGLVEEELVRRPDGGRAGYWRVTPQGIQFLQLQTKLPKYAEVYNGRVIGMDTSEVVSIKDALGEKFDYSDLMSGL